MSDAAMADAATDAGTDTATDKGQQQTERKDARPPAGAQDTVASKPGDVDPGDGGPQGYWPDDWKDKAAGGDEKLRKLLDRITDPGALAKKVAEQEKKIRSYKPAPEHPGKDATKEEIAEYRKSLGIPETHEAYVEGIKLDGNKLLGEDDRPMADYFAKVAHSLNIPPAQYNAMVGAMLEYSEDIAADRVARDDDNRKATRDALRDEWGANYKRNINTINLLFQDAPDEFEEILAGRTKSGTLIGDDPRVIKFLVGLAHKVHDEATITPTGGVSSIKDIDTRLGELNKLVAKDNSEYWRGPTSQALQKEYADLLTAKEALGKRRAA